MTVGLGTALEEFNGFGVAAVLLLLTSLGANLVSYGTAQKDMLARLEYLQSSDDVDSQGNESGNRWTRWTTALNVLAGFALLLGGVALGAFVWTMT